MHLTSHPKIRQFWEGASLIPYVRQIFAHLFFAHFVLLSKINTELFCCLGSCCLTLPDFQRGLAATSAVPKKFVYPEIWGSPCDFFFSLVI